jgi:hypothetical protein
MAILEIELVKECTFPRVKFARYVRERVERYNAFCGAPKLADLVERALVKVMDKDGGCRGQENGGAAIPGKDIQRWFVKRVSPADKTGGAP